ncbi:hypothetical protein Pfo_024185 [Paulownia fortunei]|nr:hypothetical protein Pfo_024185 [Paulownia fortunei]
MELKGANIERHPPWLLISHGQQHEKQCFYSIPENRFHATSIPELCDKYVLGCAYGWLVLVDTDTDDCCLWNPVSMEKIELPQLEYSSMYNRCVLSKPPTEPDCHILFNSSSASHRAFCQVGDDEFVIQLSVDEEIYLLAAASFQGKIYGFTLPGYRFVSVHFVDKTLELRPILKGEGEGEGGQPWHIPSPSRTWVTMLDNYLIESPCGELLLVHKMYLCSFLYDGLDFRVFRVDTNQKECMELCDIGKRAIFLSHCGGGFCSSSAGIKPNSIYYTVPDSRNLYVYDLNDRSTTPLLPCPAARRSQSVSCWVEYQVFQK